MRSDQRSHVEPVPVTVGLLIGLNVQSPENSRLGIRDDKFWADFLGVDPTDWSTIGVSVQPHVGLRGYRGLWCFRRNRRIVVSAPAQWVDRKSTRLNSSHLGISYAVFCLKKKKI